MCVTNQQLTLASGYPCSWTHYDPTFQWELREKNVQLCWVISPVSEISKIEKNVMSWSRVGVNLKSN